MENLDERSASVRGSESGYGKHARGALPAFAFRRRLVPFTLLSDPPTLVPDIGKNHTFALGNNLKRAVPLRALGTEPRGGAPSRTSGRGALIGCLAGAEYGFNSIHSRAVTLLRFSHVVADLD